MPEFQEKFTFIPVLKLVVIFILAVIIIKNQALFGIVRFYTI